MEAKVEKTSYTAVNPLVIVIDPGHGTSVDLTGATAQDGSHEADLNMKISLYCKAALEQYDNVKVYLTHSYVGENIGADNVSDDLVRRTEIAKEHKADLLLCLHNNAGGGNGAEVYYPNANYRPDLSEVGKELASQIESQLVSLGIANRGTKVRDTEGWRQYPDGSDVDYYSIIRNAKLRGITAVTVEHAFVDSSDYSNYLNSDDKLKKLGEADAQGVANYYNLTLGPNYYNGVNYSAVFDGEYYLNKYPDLKAAFGDDVRAALVHFVNTGMHEGRQGSENFNVHSYRNEYSDLRAAFGSDLPKYYYHYMNYGIFEGRQGTGYENQYKAATIYNGIDYSPVYDYSYYTNKYPDIQAAFGSKSDDMGALRHFVNYGMKEGRQGSAQFNVRSYHNEYPDLRSAFGTNWNRYYDHYLKYGRKEHRDGTGYENKINAATVYNGIDYSSVYNYDYYRNKYPDIQNAFGKTLDDIGALRHFVNYGMKEGRQGSAQFNVRSYHNEYPDLRSAFGTNWNRYYDHYLKYGRKEHRDGTGYENKINAVTVHNGIDYSAVYNFDYYRNKYPDIQNAFGKNLDDIGALRHFVNYGMKEGRKGSENFDPRVYRENYADLQNAFGTNWPRYYSHYLNYGIHENRIASKLLAE